MLQVITDSFPTPALATAGARPPQLLLFYFIGAFSVLRFFWRLWSVQAPHPAGRCSRDGPVFLSIRVSDADAAGQSVGFVLFFCSLFQTLRHWYLINQCGNGQYIT
jgi:hypothetical protein